MRVPITSFAVTALCATVAPRAAHACGGCFGPPDAVQTVTDHRMVLSISQTQTTLWDQFSYAGSPTDFSWILPISYQPGVDVRLADNRFMTILDNITVPELSRPYPPNQYCTNYDTPTEAVADASAAADAGSVVVYQQSVVGPYAVAIVGGSDAMAIQNWLTANGYVVPPAVATVIDHYTSLHMDYVALRLQPGEGVSQMSPVRVTVPGYAPTLPLEMIAAGIGDKVGLDLIVIANGRMEAQNFANGVVTNSMLTYDFDHPTDPVVDFESAESQVSMSLGGAAWITESAAMQDSYSLINFATNAQYVLQPTTMPCAGGDGGVDGSVPDASPSDASSDANADAGMCTPPNPVDDMHVALSGIAAPYLSRLHADLGPGDLNRDLTVAASTGADVSRYYQYANVLNAPPPVTCPGPQQPGTVSGTRYRYRGTTTTGSGGSAAGGSGCSIGRGESQDDARDAVLALAAVAIATSAARRRRRR